MSDCRAARVLYAGLRRFINGDSNNHALNTRKHADALVVTYNIRCETSLTPEVQRHKTRTRRELRIRDDNPRDASRIVLAAKNRSRGLS